MKRIFILWLLVCCASLSAYAADAPDKKKKARTAPASPKTVEKSWMPEAFPQEIERLPAGYTGLNPLKFLTLFQTKVDALKKGEFEPTEEYIQRTADKEKAITPFNFKDWYAFKIDGMEFKYNPDVQAYTVRKHNLCTGKILRSDEEGIKCNVIGAKEVEERYSAQTAGGALFTVTLTKQLMLGFSLEPNSNIHARKIIFGEDEGNLYRGRESPFMTFNDTFPVPLARARELKDRTLSLLFVGRVTAAQTYHDLFNTEAASFGFPREYHSTNVRIPFEIKRVVYYIVETGEILGSKDF